MQRQVRIQQRSQTTGPNLQFDLLPLGHRESPPVFLAGRRNLPVQDNRQRVRGRSSLVRLDDFRKVGDMKSTPPECHIVNAQINNPLIRSLGRNGQLDRPLRQFLAKQTQIDRSAALAAQRINVIEIHLTGHRQPIDVMLQPPAGSVAYPHGM